MLNKNSDLCIKLEKKSIYLFKSPEFLQYYLSNYKWLSNFDIFINGISIFLNSIPENYENLKLSDIFKGFSNVSTFGLENLYFFKSK